MVCKQNYLYLAMFPIFLLFCNDQKYNKFFGSTESTKKVSDKIVSGICLVVLTRAEVL